MSLFQIRDLSFQYAGETQWALKNINLDINPGDFVLLCGPSGSGKTTLLKMLKRELWPKGQILGHIKYGDINLQDISQKTSAQEIAMVLQHPESQIIMGNVRQELAFGLENLNYPTNLIRKRLADMSTYFGLADKMDFSVNILSGGQKQVLSLAGAMTMRPAVLLLDEPTSQLDPVAAQRFLDMVFRLNRETGITVIMSEHRVERVFANSDSVIILDSGVIKYMGTPECVSREIWNQGDARYFCYLPSVTNLYFHIRQNNWDKISCCEEIPFTVKQAKRVFKDIYIRDKASKPKPLEKKSKYEPIIKCNSLCFQYDRSNPLVINRLSLAINPGELISLIGHNGCGKTTLLKLIAGILKPTAGKIKNTGSDSRIGYLPQNPMSFFTEDTVDMELKKSIRQKDNESLSLYDPIVQKLELSNLLKRHPLDLSGGERQKAALGCILLAKPKILLLDEPTKGMDPMSKDDFYEILRIFLAADTTVIMATHDVDFVSKYVDRCILLFDGFVAADGMPGEVLGQNLFYTTVINRVFGDRFPDVLTWEEVWEKIDKE